MTTRDVLGLVGYSISLREAQAWTPDDRKRAADWCYAVYLNNQDMRVSIPQKPDFIEQYKSKR
jgi:hypothetical protein